MSTVVKNRRGNSAEHNTFTGSEGEVTYVTNTHELRTHDGVKPGGYTILTELGTVARMLGIPLYSVKYTTPATSGNLLNVQYFLDQLTGGIWKVPDNVTIAGTVASFSNGVITTTTGQTVTCTLFSMEALHAGSGNGGGSGAQGSQGATGAQGAAGTNGTNGINGAQGSVGAQGASGDGGSGMQGAQGPQGAQGSVGAQGAIGVTGAQGSTGSGSQGAQGSTGAQGNMGQMGLGTNGAQGAQGAQGSSGSSSSNAIFIGRSTTQITFTDSASAFSYHATPLIPSNALVTSGSVSGTTITLNANTLYTGWCEVLLDSTNDDLSQAELALVHTTNFASTAAIISQDTKQLSSGFFDKVKLKIDFIIRPTSTITASIRIGFKGTGVSIPAQVSSNAISYFNLMITTQG